MLASILIWSVMLCQRLSGILKRKKNFLAWRFFLPGDSYLVLTLNQNASIFFVSFQIPIPNTVSCHVFLEHLSLGLPFWPGVGGHRIHHFTQDTDQHVENLRTDPDPFKQLALNRCSLSMSQNQGQKTRSGLVMFCQHSPHLKLVLLVIAPISKTPTIQGGCSARNSTAEVPYKLKATQIRRSEPNKVHFQHPPAENWSNHTNDTKIWINYIMILKYQQYHIDKQLFEAWIGSNYIVTSSGTHVRSNSCCHTCAKTRSPNNLDICDFVLDIAKEWSGGGQWCLHLSLLSMDV